MQLPKYDNGKVQLNICEEIKLTFECIISKFFINSSLLSELVKIVLMQSLMNPPVFNTYNQIIEYFI